MKDEYLIMEAYFIRHTKRLSISEEFLGKCFEEKKIFIHFPSTSGDIENDLKKGIPDSESLEPDDYKKSPDDYKNSAKGAMTCLCDLAKKGGYVWAQYYTNPKKALIGWVKQDTDIVIDKNESWKPKNKQYLKLLENKKRTAVLKTLQLKNAMEVNVKDCMVFNAARPPGLTISRWPSKEKLLKAIIDNKRIEPEWGNLSPDQQEVVCYEYLKNRICKKIPKLEHLLMPIGRTLKDVDIYAIDTKGKYIFAQVTFYDKTSSQNKINNLKFYEGENNTLIFFCDCPEVEYEDNIWFIPTKIVKEWFSESPENSKFKEVMFKPLKKLKKLWKAK